MLKIKEWYLKKIKGQHSFIYCSCGNELISSNSSYTTKDKRRYKFQCNKCGKRSLWLLETPVPIKIDK